MKGNLHKKTEQDNFIKHWVASAHNHPQGWKWWKRRTRKRFRKSQKEEANEEGAGNDD